MTVITTSATRADARLNRREAKLRRRKAIIAAICGGALLLGGSTFALWTQSASLSAGNINTGKFNVRVLENKIEAYDVSEDRPHGKWFSHAVNDVPGRPGDPIDVKKFGMVPGDHVMISFLLDVTLDGENLLAKLSADFSGLFADDMSEFVDLEVHALVYESGENYRENPLDLGADKVDLGYFASPDLLDADGERYPGGIWYVDDRPELRIIVSATFKGDVDAAQGVDSTIDLGGAVFNLTQVRANGEGLGGFPTPED
jgi:alternate signal-mediated exported protein